MESLGHNGQLTQLSHGFDTWNDGYGDAHLTGFLDKIKVFLVVKEQLSDCILCTQVLLLFQILHVALQIGGFLMFLRVAGYTKVELRTGVLDGGAVCKKAFIEACHLLNEVCGMSMTTWCRLELAVFLCLVATQQHEIPNSQELQVEQLVFNILNSSSTADNMGLYRNVIAMLNGCCNSYRAWTTADALTFELSIAKFLIDVFGVVSGDIDKGRIEYGQLIYRLKQSLRAITFEGWQYFEGEMLLFGVKFDIVCYCHD